ncbi:MAG: cytochrome c [Pirellulaceae bacterium]|nr:cytochrome c [Pirellulaceae bacterium]
MRISLLLLAVAISAAFVADEQPAAKSRPQPAVLEKLPAKHLPNALQVHPRVISGGQPEGEAGFAELKALGVKTVISVDGAKPDVELAKKYGLRYVHLPHGYDGILEERVEELAKAVRDLPGPIYIHCHHGKHRSPAAASAACVGAGLIEPKDARQVLVVAGTSESYRGLYQSAQNAKRFDDKLLDALGTEFPSVAKLPPMAEAMVGVEHANDHLKFFAANKWRPIKDQPALEPDHEALLLREHFTELLRTKEIMDKPQRFQELMQEGEAAAQDLEKALKDWIAAGRPEKTPDAFPKGMDRIAKNCTACHKQFRDVPLGEKK